MIDMEETPPPALIELQEDAQDAAQLGSIVLIRCYLADALPRFFRRKQWTSVLLLSILCYR